MAEIGDAPLTGDPCRDVVRQLVRAVQRDADFAYLINPFTTTGERICAALVALDGVSPEGARDQLRCFRREKPRVKVLEARIAELEAKLETAEEQLVTRGLPLFEAAARGGAR